MPQQSRAIRPQDRTARDNRFAGIVGRERVIAGTDCGFGTFVGFGAINDAVAWLKLGALAEGAWLAADVAAGFLLPEDALAIDLDAAGAKTGLPVPTG